MLQVLVSRILALLNAIGSLVAHDVDKTIKSSIQSEKSGDTNPFSYLLSKILLG